MSGHRGLTGELTVRVPAGDASIWKDVTQVWIAPVDGSGRTYDVERSRAYRDRLVLKLGGIDDPGAAEALRGMQVQVAKEQAPTLPEGEHYVAELVGLRVLDDEGTDLGVVEDVVPTGGPDLLIVRRPDSTEEELMIPMAADLVLDVALEERRLRVRLPEGLLDLNRKPESRR